MTGGGSGVWPEAILVVHAAATLYMTGLIWFVQIVHYPLAASVPEAGFSAYQRRHMDRTGLVVGPPMLVEFVAAAALLVLRPPGVPDWMLFAGFGLLAAVWASTAFVQVPLHHKLCAGFDVAAARRLVSTNWVRTAAWTLRAGLAVCILAQERTA